MTKNDRTILIVTTFVCLLPLVLNAAVYTQLPEQVAIHWGVSGEPNSWIPKEYIWVLPAGMALMNVVMQLVFSLDPRRTKVSGTFTRILVWIMPVITMILYPVTIFYALGVNIPIALVALLIVGMLILVIGNYLPKTRRNYFVGVRVPWTLKSEENWNKTHRIAGRLWTAGGLLLIIIAFAMQGVPALMFTLTMVLVTLMTVIPIIYSYRLYKSEVQE
ncbi:MAG: SdpI family protein [Spirochaetaceae bacterium]|jgi:uncharacterized membrane protein|nr:SdpI family protein [Spirochaetaceae bacterium]